MTDCPIDLRTHIHFASIWRSLGVFHDLTESGDYEYSLNDFEKYVSERYFNDLKPFWKFTLEEVVDDEDRRYPSEKWLASISEVGRRFSYSQALSYGNVLLEQLRTAWFFGDDEDIFHFDDKTKVLTAYTSGWSGCEDIVFALGLAFPQVDCHHANLIFDMRYFSWGGKE